MTEHPRKIAVAVSGGMDSLLAVALLIEAGHDVLSLHAHFLPPTPATRQKTDALERACSAAGASFAAIDLSVQFETEVIRPFVQGYADGFTPNPCSACNPAMKFGMLMDAAELNGYDHFATGHYARIEPNEHDRQGRHRLLRGLDPTKDQSYFLSLVKAERLARIVFPLGTVRKADVPAELARRGLTPPLPSESQEICFIADDDYCAFLTDRAPGLGIPLTGPGDIVLRATNATLGRHRGLWRYTLGQRRGLGIAWSEPLYVVGRDVESNTLLVGEARELESHGCGVREVNWLVEPADWPEALLAQTRYRQKAAPVAAQVTGEDAMSLRFTPPRTLPAPGQIAAIYDERGAVLAGGIITAPKPPLSS